jgi:hypothetical protein
MRFATGIPEPFADEDEDEDEDEGEGEEGGTGVMVTPTESRRRLAHVWQNSLLSVVFKWD